MAERRRGERDRSKQLGVAAPEPGAASVQSAFIDCEDSLKRLIARICRGDRDVEDIAHEAFVSALQAESSVHIEHPEAYLFRAAKNLAVRTRARKARDIIGYVDEAVRMEVASTEPSVEEQVISRQRLALICEAIATLPPSCRRVFVMRKVYGYSHKEISDLLGISTSTVEKHLATGFSRCLAFLRDRGGADFEDLAEREAGTGTEA